MLARILVQNLESLGTLSSGSATMGGVLIHTMCVTVIRTARMEKMNLCNHVKAMEESMMKKNTFRIVRITIFHVQFQENVSLKVWYVLVSFKRIFLSIFQGLQWHNGLSRW